MRAHRYLMFVVNLSLTALFVALPGAGVADIVLKTKNDKASDVAWKNHDGTDPIACEGYTELANPPPGAGLYLLTTKTKGQGNTERQSVFFAARPDSNGSECGHTHEPAMRPVGPNVACHRYVWQDGQWVLIHICP